MAMMRSKTCSEQSLEASGAMPNLPQRKIGGINGDQDYVH
jgi:hypothetical protein